MSLVFEAIVKTIKQGKPSVTHTGTCCYESKNGDRCVVGHMLTPDQLQVVKGSYCVAPAIAEILQEHSLPIQDPIVSNSAALYDLQQCRDRAAHLSGEALIAEFTARVEAWKKDYGLLNEDQMDEIKRLSNA